MLGFAISAVVQAWVPRERIEPRSSGGGARPVALATGARRGLVLVLLRGDRDRQVAVHEGRVGGVALAFQFASTNLVLGARARPVGPDRLAVHARRVRRRHRADRADDAAAAAVRLAAARGPGARARAAGRRPATSTTPPATQLTWRERLRSAAAWSDVAHNFRGDWQMLWKEIAIGFLLAGFIGLLGDDFFNALFLDRRARRRCRRSRT